MKQKTTKIIYWTVTILFALFMTLSGISEVMQTESAQQLMISLGYPIYLNLILGVAKLLGVFAILQTKFKTIKEWAYAGFTFDLLGASTSFVLVGESNVMGILFPLIFLAVMFYSYFLFKKVDKN